MNALLVCPHCGLLHPVRDDRVCPRCRKQIGQLQRRKKAKDPKEKVPLSASALLAVRVVGWFLVVQALLWGVGFTVLVGHPFPEHPAYGIPVLDAVLGLLLALERRPSPVLGKTWVVLRALLLIALAVSLTRPLEGTLFLVTGFVCYFLLEEGVSLRSQLRGSVAVLAVSVILGAVGLTFGHEHPAATAKPATKVQVKTVETVSRVGGQLDGYVLTFPAGLWVSKPVGVAASDPIGSWERAEGSATVELYVDVHKVGVGGSPPDLDRVAGEVARSLSDRFSGLELLGEALSVAGTRPEPSRYLRARYTASARTMEMSCGLFLCPSSTLVFRLEAVAPTPLSADLSGELRELVASFRFEGSRCFQRRSAAPPRPVAPPARPAAREIPEPRG